MPRKPAVFWHAGANAWCSTCGPRGDNGRRRPHYFREIPNTDRGRRAAEAALGEYLKARDRREADRVEDATNPRVWGGLVKPYLEYVWALVERGKASEETHRTHRDRLLKWCKSPDRQGRRFADRLAGSLVAEDGDAWVAWLAAEGRRLPGDARGPLSATRIDGLLRSVNACLNWAASPVANRTPRVILPRGNPWAKVVKADPAEARRVQVATPGEVARFLRAARSTFEPWHAGGRTADDWYRPGRVARCAACRKAGRPGPCRRSHNMRAIYFRAALLLCRLQAAMGCRPKELCTATWKSQVRVKGKDLPGWTPRAWQDPGTGHWWGLIIVPGKTIKKTNRPRTIPVPPLIARGIERLRARGLHPEAIFPRLSRSGGPGRWTTEGIDARVRQWREAAGLGPDFVLYALRHRFYTAAVNRAGLSADQAGQIGGTSGRVVEDNYLQSDLDPIFANAALVRGSSRAGKPRPGVTDA